MLELDEKLSENEFVLCSRFVILFSCETFGMFNADDSKQLYCDSRFSR